MIADVSGKWMPEAMYDNLAYGSVEVENMKLYILRHGETDWNKKRLLQGKSDVPLNKTGRTLAKASAVGMKEIPFELVISSPLERARETAHLVLGEREIPFILDERIEEIGFGEMEGKPWRKTEDFPGDENIYQFFNHPDRYIPPKGAESLTDLAKRCADFMQDICHRPDLEDKTILIATHGAATRGLLNSLRDWKIEDFWGGRVAPNCGVAIVESHHGQAKLIAENITYY